MFSPPTRKATTPCSSQRAEYEKKNTEHRAPSGESSVGLEIAHKGGRVGLWSYAPNRFKAENRTRTYDARDSYEGQKKNTEHRTTNIERRTESAAIWGQ